MPKQTKKPTKVTALLSKDQMPDVFAFLNRFHLERMEMASRSIRDVIRKYFVDAPYRVLYRLNVHLDSDEYSLFPSEDSNSFWENYNEILPFLDRHNTRVATTSIEFPPKWASIAASKKPGSFPSIAVKLDSLAHVWITGKLCLSFQDECTGQDVNDLLMLSTRLMQCTNLELDVHNVRAVSIIPNPTMYQADEITLRFGTKIDANSLVHFVHSIPKERCDYFTMKFDFQAILLQRANGADYEELNFSDFVFALQKRFMDAKEPCTFNIECAVGANVEMDDGWRVPEFEHLDAQNYNTSECFQVSYVEKQRHNVEDEDEDDEEYLVNNDKLDNDSLGECNTYYIIERFTFE
ncbi:hypothetical protein Ddc_18106 [Ditylenchus destructor]|nr:hypothetical protein Ddc_18106 [Ditylenchus destructor]